MPMDGEKLEIEKRLDERHARTDKSWNKLIIFAFILCVVLYGAAALWAALATDPFPLASLQRQVAQPFVAWVVFLMSLWSAWLYFTREARNPDALIFIAGMVVAVGITVMLYLGGAGGAVFWLGLFLYKGAVSERERRAEALLTRLPPRTDHEGAL